MKEKLRAKVTSVHTFSEVNPKNIFGETSLKNLPEIDCLDVPGHQNSESFHVSTWTSQGLLTAPGSPPVAMPTCPCMVPFDFGPMKLNFNTKTEVSQSAWKIPTL